MLSFETRKRRAALILLPVLILASWAVACGETTTETVIQTVVVEKEVIVEREGETVVRNGVKVMGPGNLPAGIPVHASQMFAKNVATLLKELVTDGELSLDFEDEVVATTCVSHGGEVRHGPTRERLGLA